MAKSAFIEGSNVRAQVDFLSPAGAHVDPTTVTVKYKNPDGTETTKAYGTDAEVVKSGTGIYYIDIDTTDKRGEWRVAWRGTGTNQAADDYVFRVYSPYEGDQY